MYVHTILLSTNIVNYDTYILDGKKSATGGRAKGKGKGHTLQHATEKSDKGTWHVSSDC